MNETASAHIARSLDLLQDMLDRSPLTAPEIDAVTRRRWREGQWDVNDRATRALTLREPHSTPGCGLLYDRLRRLEAAGRITSFRVSWTRTVLWWAN